MWLGKNSELITLSEARVFTSDYGKSPMPFITTHHYLSTIVLSAPPEVRFAPQTTPLISRRHLEPCCTVWSIFGTKTPCEGFAPTDDWMMKEHVTVLCKLPSEWWGKWDASAMVQRDGHGPGWRVGNIRLAGHAKGYASIQVREDADCRRSFELPMDEGVGCSRNREDEENEVRSLDLKSQYVQSADGVLG